jgi:hypothetical protein
MAQHAPRYPLIRGTAAQEVLRPHNSNMIEVDEVGYCSDTNHEARIRESEGQHKKLVDTLHMPRQKPKPYPPP